MMQRSHLSAHATDNSPVRAHSLPKTLDRNMCPRDHCVQSRTIGRLNGMPVLHAGAPCHCHGTCAPSQQACRCASAWSKGVVVMKTWVASIAGRGSFLGVEEGWTATGSGGGRQRASRNGTICAQHADTCAILIVFWREMREPLYR